MAGNNNPEAYVVTLDIKSSKGDHFVSHIEAVYKRLKYSFRKSGRFPNSSFDLTQRKAGILLVSGVPEKDLKAALETCRAEASKDHGYNFTYELCASDISPQEIESNEIESLEDCVENLENSAAKTQEELDVTKKRLYEANREIDELEGKLKISKLKDKAPTVQEVRKDEYPIINSYKAIVELVSTYSPNLERLDIKLNQIHNCYPEINLDKLLEIADTDFEKFIMKDGGEDLAVAMYSLTANNSLIDKSKLVSDKERSDLRKLAKVHELADLYSKLINTLQKLEQVLPCAIVPKNANELSIYVPSGPENGIISQYLGNALKGILEKKDMRVIIQNRGLANELVVKFNGGATPSSLAKRLAVELKEEANRILPNKIGHKLVVVNALKD
jgi:archaellum component FlaC